MAETQDCLPNPLQLWHLFILLPIIYTKKTQPLLLIQLPDQFHTNISKSFRINCHYMFATSFKIFRDSSVIIFPVKIILSYSSRVVKIPTLMWNFCIYVYLNIFVWPKLNFDSILDWFSSLYWLYSIYSIWFTLLKKTCSFYMKTKNESVYDFDLNWLQFWVTLFLSQIIGWFIPMLFCTNLTSIFLIFLHFYTSVFIKFPTVRYAQLYASAS